jgi:hypothetical protein
VLNLVGAAAGKIFPVAVLAPPEKTPPPGVSGGAAQPVRNGAPLHNRVYRLFSGLVSLFECKLP